MRLGAEAGLKRRRPILATKTGARVGWRLDTEAVPIAALAAGSADKLLSKLVATGDYASFCRMMRTEHDCGGMGC